jgi:hypothetical protein
MADVTVVDRFPKATVTRADIESARESRLASGAKSTILSENDQDWILTTIWPDIEGIGPVDPWPRR